MDDLRVADKFECHESHGARNVVVPCCVRVALDGRTVDRLEELAQPREEGLPAADRLGVGPGMRLEELGSERVRATLAPNRPRPMMVTRSGCDFAIHASWMIRDGAIPAP